MDHHVWDIWSGGVGNTAADDVPVAILLLRMKGAAWRSPEAAGAVAMCIILFLFAIDNLLNAMPIRFLFWAWVD